MSLPKEPFSWDERSDEVPIPLVETRAATVDDGDPIEAVVDEAEIVVREAQAALAHDDPNPTTLSAIRNRVFPSHLTVGPGDLFRSRRRRAAALVAACALAFAHGWHQGSTTSPPGNQDSRGAAAPRVTQITVQSITSIWNGGGNVR